MLRQRKFSLRIAAIGLLIVLVLGGAVALGVLVIDSEGEEGGPSLFVPTADVAATQTMDERLATVDSNKLPDAIIQEAQTKGTAWVSVGIVEPPMQFAMETMDEWKAATADIQDQILASIANHDFELTNRLSGAGFYMVADLDTLIDLQAHPLVSRIALVETGTGSTRDLEAQTTPQASPSVDVATPSIAVTQTMDALLVTVDRNKLGDEVIAAAQAQGEVWVSVGLDGQRMLRMLNNKFCNISKVMPIGI